MKRRKDKGITLIALVITIIVLLILAEIGIAMLTGENGILTKAQEITINYKKSEIEEEIELAILEIKTELASENLQESLNPTRLVTKLPNKLSNLTINEDMTGKYKGYPYWIDNQYHVHVEEKIDNKNPIYVELLATYIGTNSCTLNIEANSEQGNIVGYQYKINQELTQQFTEKNYTIENLEPDTEYTISAIAIDEKGNQNISEPIQVTTKSRTYLIKDGKPQMQGQITNNTTATERNGYLSVVVNSTISRGGYYFSYDITKYKKIKTDTEVINKTGNAMIVLWILEGMTGPGIKQGNIALPTDESVKRNIYEIDVTELTGTYDVCEMKNSTGFDTSAEFNIYDLWLEE